MKNNLKYFLLILFFIITIIKNVHANEPFEFKLGEPNIIELWNIALPTMSKGEKAIITGRIKIRDRVKAKFLNGYQNQGNSVTWFQSMKSGIPGVV